MNIDKEKIVRILLDENYITEDDVKKSKKISETNRISILDALMGEGIISKDIVGQALAEFFAVPYADLNTNRPSCPQVYKIPEDVAKKFRAVLYEETPKTVVITTDSPVQKDFVVELTKVFPNKKIKVAFSLPDDIDISFTCYEKSIESKFLKIIEAGIQVAPKILDAIFKEAVGMHVSDIHIEPIETGVLIRFRVDGVLRDIAKLPRDQYENILNRIKVQSGIRLDEHFAAQDGAMKFSFENVSADLRVSIVPTVEGEKAVLRVLSTYVQSLSLNEIGLLEKHRKTIEASSQKPFGMIMVAGPTGSGKTTTLYALLKILNKSNVNITTIEDPVEYKMKGVNQIQVNPLTNLTFAKGLRSIVRQDPDIILVGEIRDEETAEISVNAALTGHLLLSTFHANDAATAIPRMLDMGTEPFLLASTLELIVAQRLVRKICDNCKHSITLDTKDIIKKYPTITPFLTKSEYTLYEGKGCEICGHSGFLGRTAIFEVIEMTPELQELILKNPSSQEIWNLVRKQGVESMFEDGIEKVKNGITTISELVRVAEAPKKA